LGIAARVFNIIQPDQDLYCSQFDFNILKLSRTLLTNYVGDLLISQAGSLYADTAKLFIVHWDGKNFVIRSISYNEIRFENVTFAPIDLP